MKKITLFLAVIVAAWMFGLTASAVTRYVKPASAGVDVWDGQTLVYNTIAAAVAAADANDEIWIAEGEYEVAAAITLKSVKIYGGFAGAESAIEERDKAPGSKPWEFINTSTIKATNTASITGIFSYGTAASLAAVVDGITFDGNSKTAKAFNITATLTSLSITRCVIKNFNSAADGGGMNLRGTGSKTVSYCQITNNSGGKGGGAYLETTVIRDCEITNNSVPTDQTSYQGSTNGGGGGLLLANTAGTAAYNCYIAGNKASFGGGIFARINSKIYNNIIVNNTSQLSGSGIAFDGRENGGEVYNSIIANNESKSDDGAGVCFTSTATGAKVQKLSNSILYNNTDNSGTVVNTGSFVSNGSATPTIKNNIVDALTTDITVTNGNIAETDPAKLFTDIASGNYVPPTTGFAGEDKGDATGLTFADNKDYAGNFRVQGAAIEIGAYEIENTDVGLTVEVGSGIASATPNGTSTVVLGLSQTIYFTLADGNNYAYVLVNGVFTPATDNTGTYSITFTVNGQTTVKLAGYNFADNVLPVSYDTYGRRSDTPQNSGYYANSAILESRGGGSNFQAMPLLVFTPTDAMKAAGYNKATLKFTVNSASGAERTLSVRQISDERDIDAVTSSETQSFNTYFPTLVGVGGAYTPPVSEVLLDVSVEYVLDMPNVIRLAVPTTAGPNSVTSFHSLENGNPAYVPQLVFEKTTPTGLPEVTIDDNAPVRYYNLQGIEVSAPVKGNIYIVKQGARATKMLVK